MEREEGTEELVVHWMDGQPAPTAVLDSLACNCSRKCTLPKCECMANGLKCTEMCKLKPCENQVTFEESEDEEVDGEDLDEEEDEYDNEEDEN